MGASHTLLSPDGGRRLAALLALLMQAACGVSGPPSGSVLWLNASSIGDRPGSRIASWPDESGLAHDARVVSLPPGIARAGAPPDRRPRLDSDPTLGGRSVVTFDGTDDLLGIEDAEDLNLGGPYGRRTIILLFRTGDDVVRRQMLFETGGDLRGFNVYIDGGFLYLGAYDLWNDDAGATTPFGPLHVKARVRPHAPYVAVLELDQPRGELRGYLDDRLIEVLEGAGRVFVHHEDIGIGAINEDTYYHDGVRQGVPTGDFFGGAIAGILVYNRVLSGREREDAERFLRRSYGLERRRDPAGSAREESAPAATGSVFAASGIGDVLVRLEAADGAVSGRVPVDRRRDEVDEPHGVAVSPDGSHLYVSLAHGEPTLWKFELPAVRLVGRVALPMAGAARIGISPDGMLGFVPDYDRSRPASRGAVAVVRLGDLTLQEVLRPCAGPHQAEPDPTGRRVAVACSLGDEIVLIDTSTLAEAGRFRVDAEAGSSGEPRFKPLNLTWAPGGDVLYVGMHLTDRVRAFDLEGRVLGTVRVGEGPAQIAMTPDGRTLVSANRRDRSVSIVSIPEMIERKRVRLGAGAEHPHGLTLDAAGRTAFVTCEGTPETSGEVVAVDVAAGRVLWRSSAVRYGLGIAWAPDARE